MLIWHRIPVRTKILYHWWHLVYLVFRKHTNVTPILIVSILLIKLTLHIWHELILHLIWLVLSIKTISWIWLGQRSIIAIIIQVRILISALVKSIAHGLRFSHWTRLKVRSFAISSTILLWTIWDKDLFLRIFQVITISCFWLGIH